MLALAGCTTFDPLDHRVESINRDATDYAYNATLLNIVHAKLSEPLTFLSITGLDGTDTVTGTLGVPSVTFGPHLLTSSGDPIPRNFTVGPNSVGRTGSNLYHVSVVDDPASFAALLAPVNPALIAFFQNQGYDRSLLFFLFTERVRKLDNNGDLVAEYFNDPDNNTPRGFGAFIGEMASLLHSGLIAQIDITAIPTGRSLPSSRLCMDPSYSVAFAEIQPSGQKETCGGTRWIEAQPATGSSGSGSGAAIAVAHDDSLWVLRSDQAIHVTPAGKIDSFKLQPASPVAPKPGPLVAFEFSDPEGNRYQLYTRSAYGAYGYVGALLRNGTDIDNLQSGAKGYGGIINVTQGTQDCFAEIDYRDVHYCVPNQAVNTKRLFALLHQLQEIDTAPSNAPTTLTVHEVP
jgi:hypothetical protein